MSPGDSGVLSAAEVVRVPEGGGGTGEAEDFGCLFDRETREKSEFDQSGRLFVGGSKFFEGLVDSEELSRRFNDNKRR